MTGLPTSLTAAPPSLTAAPQAAVAISAVMSATPRTRLFPAVFAGTYSWVLTVLPAVVAAGWTSLSALGGAIALLSLLISPLLTRGRFALLTALDLFVGGSILAWWGVRDLDITLPFGVFGSLGWLAYTFALGALSTPAKLQEVGDPGPELHPRIPPSRAAAAVLITVFASCLIVLASAWQVERPSLGVLAHIVALGVILLSLRTGAHLAVFFQVRGSRIGAPLGMRRALIPLTLLLGSGGLAVYLAFRP